MKRSTKLNPNTLPNLTIRPARRADYDRLMPFINRVFFGGKPMFESNFAHIYLPPEKAYRWAHLLFQGDELVGHLGIYPLWIKVGPALLRTGGIGAVATAPECRGQGVMSKLLVYADERMRRDGLDISILWGDRYRYGNYGWEVCGDFVEWGLDARRAGAADARPLRLRPYDPRRDFSKVLKLWNAEPAGTWQPHDRLDLILKRPDWKTFVTASGPFAFAACALNAEKTFLRVEKMAGPAKVLKGVLLGLAKQLKDPSGRIAVMLPSNDHPLAGLAVRHAAYWSRSPIGQVKIVNLRSTVINLLPLLNQRHIPQKPQTLTLRMKDQSVTLQLARDVRVSAGPEKNVLSLSEGEAVRLIFGSPLTPRYTGKLSALNNLFPIPWFYDRNAMV